MEKNFEYLFQHTVDPPKIKKKLITNFHQITSIFYILLEDSFGVKSISKFVWDLEAYIKSYINVIHLRLRATEQSSFMKDPMNVFQCHVYFF